MFLFNLYVVFTSNFLKMAPIIVRFSPGFPPGAGFHREVIALACFERHARAMKNGAFFTEAALACSQEQNFTERNAPAYYVYSWLGQLIQHGAFFYVIVLNHAGANSSP
jgi:hypothetical protein